MFKRLITKLNNSHRPNKCKCMYLRIENSLE